MTGLQQKIQHSVRISETGCWIWTKGRTERGYGHMWAGRGRSGRVHRVAYEEWIGAIPKGLGLDHLCRNPSCCNPAHLEAVTQRENVLRGAVGLKTHCCRGHEYSEANTRRTYRGQRQCRACLRADKRAARLRNQSPEARARSAASELLGALQRILPWAEAQSVGGPDIEQDIATARAAIAKATRTN